LALEISDGDVADGAALVVLIAQADILVKAVALS
jgi:hypothetical protein